MQCLFENQNTKQSVPVRVLIWKLHTILLQPLLQTQWQLNMLLLKFSTSTTATGSSRLFILRHRNCLLQARPTMWSQKG